MSQLQSWFGPVAKFIGLASTALSNASHDPTSFSSMQGSRAALRSTAVSPVEST
jgi:hypothetical protein